MKRVPTSVVVLSIVGIILGALGLFGFCFSSVVIFGGVSLGGPSPMTDSLYHDTIYKVGSAIGLIIGLPLIILEIVGAIASLQLKPWARKGMILYAWLSLAQLVLNTIFTVAYVYPKMFAAISAAAGAAPGTREGMMGGIVGGVCGLILTPIYPICVIYFFRRPHVINAFNGIFPAAPTWFPLDQSGPPPAQ